MKHYLCLSAAFFALFIFACGDDSGGGSYGGSCNGKTYKTGDKFCFEGEIYIKCNGEEYDPNAFECIDKKLFPMCAGTPYDIARSFCHGGKIYPLCGDSTYSPVTEGCLNGNTVAPICGTNKTPYNSKTSFCSGETIYPLCGDSIWSPDTEGCLVGKIYPKCGETLYDKERSFCYDNNLYFLCGGKEYDPVDKGCLENEPSSVCGPNKTPYNETTSFCFIDNKVYPKCYNGTEYFKYFPNIEDCFDGKTYPICGPSKTVYDSTGVTGSFCFVNEVYSKCGGKKYFPNEKFCFEGNTYSFCGGKDYNVSKEFCFENAIYAKCNGEDYNPKLELCFNKKETRCPNSKYDDEFCRTENGVSVSYRICGSESYKSAGKFCFNNEVYLQCGNKEYDPYKEFCYIDTDDNGNNITDVYPRCGGNMYSPINDFCFSDNKVYKRCNGETFNPKELFCDWNKLYKLCNGVEFNPQQEFCSNYDFKVHPICAGNSSYNPKEKICYNDPSVCVNNLCYVCPDGTFSNTSNCSVKFALCGSVAYNISTHFCDKEKNSIEQKCGNKTYTNPSNKFCYPSYTDPNAQVYEKCQVPDGVDALGRPKSKDVVYNPVTQTCNNGIGLEDKILPPKCQNLNPATEFCCFGKTYLKTDPYFCFEDELYPTCGTPPTYKPNSDTIQTYSYTPRDTVCFKNIRRPKCSLDSITGPCVDNTLLRCRQLGSGPNQTIDPMPEMTCQQNGAITGKTKPDIRKPTGYDIAQIGSQVWLAENLKNDTASSVCYGNNPANCNTYGRLYDLDSIMTIDVDSLCPVGFRLPSDEDWQKLVDYAGGASIAGGRLKSRTSWSYISNNYNGLDSYGFNALAGGYYSDLVTGGPYFDEGSWSMWWSTTPRGTDAYYWAIIASDTEVRHFYQRKDLHKAYVRCLLYYKD